MIAQVVLDQNHSTFTNLDEIRGKVRVQSPTSVNVTTIVVKLEGESRTRLMPPRTLQNEKPRAQLEHHKILYKLQTVFPPPEVINGSRTLTLPPGEHEYPFSFKLPFNNSCSTSANTSGPSISFNGLSVEVAKSPTRHMKRTLPPTLSGFPGEAEIKYFVKATVARPSMFKENVRAYMPFNFCPIEPPRMDPSGAETYARRRHQFQPTNESSAKGKKSIFSRKSTSAPLTPREAPFIGVDLRLPEPAIITCNAEIPMRVVLSSLNEHRDGLSLQSLQVDLVHYTHIRAHEVVRTEAMGTTITSRSNLGITINFPEGSDNAVLDPRLWRGFTVPNNLAPSFETCNISRSYELVTRIGLKHELQNSQPQHSMTELRLPVQVFSGIAPPPELLRAMMNPRAPSRKQSKSSMVPGGTLADTRPASAHTESVHSGPPEYSDAPPSYADAVADQMPSVGGQRPQYAPPSGGDDPLLAGDEKRALH